MKENETSVLEQYDIEIKSTRKVRGAILCESEQGLFLLKKVTKSEKRIPVLDTLYSHLEQSGFMLVDTIVKNKEQNLVTASEDGEHYVLKKWYSGKECDCRKEEELLGAVKNLARLHQIFETPIVFPAEMNVVHADREDLRLEYERHNRELRKVRAFVRKKVNKGEFERMFLQCFDEMYSWASETSAVLAQSDYELLFQESKKNHPLIHGDYNYHNVWMTRAGVVTTGFEHFCEGIQMADLYYFMRKTLEKNHWDLSLGDHMLNAYSARKPLRDAELEYLWIRLSYPEKFWKSANTYCRFRKTWIPVNCIEKLRVSVLQMEEKKCFLGMLEKML